MLNLYFSGLLSDSSLYPAREKCFLSRVSRWTLWIWNIYAGELPIESVSSVVYSLFIVLVIGLPRHGGMYFTMVYVTSAIWNCGESADMLIESLIDNLGIASNILINVLMLGAFMRGTMALNMSKILNYLSPLSYVVVSLAPKVCIWR